MRCACPSCACPSAERLTSSLTPLLLAPAAPRKRTHMGQDEDRRPAKATAPFVPTVGGRVSFAPFHHPTFSECQRACQLVDPTTPTTQKHRSSEARTNLVGLLKMKISHQQRRPKRRMNSSRRRKKSRIKSRYPISLASIETKPPIRLECVRSRSRFQECQSQYSGVNNTTTETPASPSIDVNATINIFLNGDREARHPSI